MWAREIQAIAQTGLAFCKDAYDIERYLSLRQLAAQIMAAHSQVPAAQYEALFACETGYATPKVDVRGAVFDSHGRMLLVREVVDDSRWTLPGGWADVNQTPAECVIREIEEESGYAARVIKLAAVWDRARQGHPPGLFSIVKMFFVCALAGGTARTGLETNGVSWFLEHELPSELSMGRVLPHQLARMFAHWHQPAIATEFN